MGGRSSIKNFKTLFIQKFKLIEMVFFVYVATDIGEEIVDL